MEKKKKSRNSNVSLPFGNMEEHTRRKRWRDEGSCLRGQEREGREEQRAAQETFLQGNPSAAAAKARQLRLHTAISPKPPTKFKEAEPCQMPSILRRRLILSLTTYGDVKITS